MFMGLLNVENERPELVILKKKKKRKILIGKSKYTVKVSKLNIYKASRIIKRQNSKLIHIHN